MLAIEPLSVAFGFFAGVIWGGILTKRWADAE